MKNIYTPIIIAFLALFMFFEQAQAHVGESGFDTSMEVDRIVDEEKVSTDFVSVDVTIEVNHPSCAMDDGSMLLTLSGTFLVDDYTVNYTFDDGNSTEDVELNGTNIISNEILIAGLSAGSYTNITVTVSTDLMGGTCTSTPQMTTLDPPTPPTATLTSSDADNTICMGNPVTFTAGPPGMNHTFTFFINGALQQSNSMNTFTTMNLANADQVTVNVTDDDNNCTDTAGPIVMTVNQNPTPNPQATPNDVCPGTLVQLMAHPVNTYSAYSWTGPSNFMSSAPSPTIPNPVNGATYNVTVTDANGCMGSGSVSLIVKDAPEITGATPSSPSSCGGSDGSIAFTFMNVPNGNGQIITYDNGNGTFTLSVDINNGAGTANGLLTGNYNNLRITVDGCASVNNPSTVIAATQPTIAVAGSSPPSTCGAADGSINLTFTRVPDGNNYTITHNAGSFSNVVINNNSATITGVSADTYSNLSLTFSSGNCMTTENPEVTLANPEPTIAVSDFSHPSVCGAADGSIQLSFTNVPNGDYTVTHSNGSFPDVTINNGSANITGVLAGTYNNMMVTFSSGDCITTGTASVTLNEPTPTIAVTNSTSPTTCGGSNGSIDFQFTNVPAGMQTVTYNNGAFSLSVNVSVDINGTGTGTANGLVAGNYNNLTVMVNGCSSTENPDVILANPQPTITLANFTPPTTCADSDGSIQLSFTNVPNNNYTVTYTGGSFSNVSISNGNANISGISSGMYNNMNVSFSSDACTTIGDASANLTAPDPTITVVDSSNPTTCGGSDGSISFQFTNVPAGNQTISYNNGAFNVSVMVDANGMGTANGLGAGSYNTINIQIGDCVSNNENEVLTEPTAPTVSSNNFTDPTTCGGTDGTISLTFTDVPNGIYNITHDNGTFPNVSVSGGNATVSGVSEGTYTNIGITANGCTSISNANATLSDPPLPTIAVSNQQNPQTCGGSDGSISLNFNNVPNGNYTITYDGGSFPNVGVNNGSATVDNLPAGAYNNMTITANNCTSISNASATLEAPGAPTPSISSQDPNSCVQENGSFTLSGLSLLPLMYEISYTFNGNTITSTEIHDGGSITIDGLAAGGYTNIIVSTGGEDCDSAPLNTTLSPPTAPTATLTSNDTDNTLCNDESITFTAGGAGGGTYNFFVNDQSVQNGNNNTFTPSSVTNGDQFEVIITAPNDCMDDSETIAVTVNQTSAPTGNMNQPFCQTQAATVGDLEANGMAIRWYDSPNSTTPLGNGVLLADGSTYYASQTISGCESDERLAVTVTLNMPPDAGNDGSSPSCNDDNSNVNLNNVITGEENGGVWTDESGTVVSNNVSFSGVDPGTYVYTYTVQGQGACENETDQSTATITVSESVKAVSAAPNQQDICSNEEADISGTATLESGAPSSVGQWSGGSGTFTPGRSAANATYTPTSDEAGMDVILNWVVTDPCTEQTISSSDIRITVNAAVENVTADITNSGDIVCSTQAVELEASVTLANGASGTGTWTHNGSGSFGNANSGDTEYNLGSNEVAGSITLTWTANDPDLGGPCTGGESVEVMATISPEAASVEANGPSAICSTEEATLTASVTLANDVAGSGFWTGGGNDVMVNGNEFTYDPLASEAGDDIVLTWRAADPDGNGPCTGGGLTNDIPISINDGIENININGPEATCFDVPVMLSASVSRTSGNSFNEGMWSNNSGDDNAFDPSNDNQTTYTPIPSDEGNTVALTWTTADPDGSGPCLSGSADLNLLVNALPDAPTAINTEDDAICAGQATPSLNVSVSPTQNANWYNTATGGSPINGGENTLDFTPPSEGSYFAETVSSAGCNSSTRTELEYIVYELPDAAYNRSGFPFINATNTFTDESTSIDGTIIDWLWNFGEDASPDNSTEQGPHEVTWSSSGDKTITLKVTDTNNCMEEIVSPPLNISNTGCAINISTSMGGPNVNGCVGDQINFVVVSQQTSNSAIEWETSSVMWQVIGGNPNNITILPQAANLNGLTFANMVFNAPGEYTIQMTAQDIQPGSEPPCVADSDVVNVTISDLPNGTVTAIDDDICEGTQGELRFDLQGAQSGGTYNVEYTGGTQNNYSSGSVISVPVVTGNNLFEIISITENDTGCTNEDVPSTDNILVRENPEISVVSECTTSDTYELTVNISNGIAPYDVSINGVFAGQTNLDTFQSNALPDNGNNYSVEVTDVTGCVSNTEIGLENCNCLTEAGNIQMAPVSVCVGETVTINPSVGYDPDPNDVLNYKVEDENGMDITIQASNDFDYDSNLFTPGVTYTVFPVAGNETAPESGIVDVLNDPCLSIGAGVTVVWHDFPLATLDLNDADSTICPGEDLSLIITLTRGTLEQYDLVITDDAGTTILNLNNVDLILNEATEYAIPTNLLPNVPTTYTISSIGYNGATTCEQTDVASVSVDMFDPPVINGIETDDELRALQPITFFPSITPGSSDEFEYEWMFDNSATVLTAPLNGEEETVQYATQNPAAGITLTVTDGNGCSTTLGTTVNIELSAECPEEIDMNNDDGNICINEDLDVNLIVDIEGDFNFSWSFGIDNNSSTQNNSLEDPDPVAYSSAGEKEIRLTITGQGLENCIVDTAITVLPTPNVVLQGDTEVCQNQQLLYLADLGTTSADIFTWTLVQGDSTTDITTTSPTILVNWGQSGTLTVDAYYDNASNSCTDTNMLTVDIDNTENPAIDITEIELIRITREENNPTNNVVFAYPERNLCYQWYRANRENVENGTNIISDNLQEGENDQYFVANNFDIDNEIVWVEVQRPVDGACNGCFNYVYSENDIPTIGLRLAAPPAEPGLALELYPNPNDGNFQLALKGDQVGRFRLNIFDNIGRLLKQQVLDKEVPRNMIESIQLDQLNNGIYFLQVVDEQGDSNVIRFVVQQRH